MICIGSCESKENRPQLEMKRQEEKEKKEKEKEKKDKISKDNEKQKPEREKRENKKKLKIKENTGDQKDDKKKLDKKEGEPKTKEGQISDKDKEKKIKEEKNKIIEKNKDKINIISGKDLERKPMVIEEDKKDNYEKESKYLENKKKTEDIQDKQKNIHQNLRKYSDEYYRKYKDKLYGFHNTRNNCYLNSSLQLLTRVEGLKEGILDFENINTDNATRGNLLKEFKIILESIENNEKIIIPDNLKKEMGKIDDRYKHNYQEDSNEFISNFLNGIREETSNKIYTSNNNPFKRESEKLEKVAYDKFFNKFYERKGYSFLLDLFYGNYITKQYCNICNSLLSVKFSAFNMIELPIYELDKENRYSSLKIDDILNSYFSRSKIHGATCEICQEEGHKGDVYSKTRIFRLPKYLIIFFGRTANDKYINTSIKYSKTISLTNYMHEKCNKRNYLLDSVIEHSGDSDFGHYTALCQVDNDIWYYFSDSFYHENSSGFVSSNAIILLYKS